MSRRRIGFWSDQDYFLDRMNLRELAVAYFQYYAIAAYIGIALVTGVIVIWALADGAVAAWPVFGAVATTVVLYPAVWYVLHRYVLHSRWLWKHASTAKVWKRIHYDHHNDPSSLKVLFGALYTTLPTVAVVTLPVGYAFGGSYAALAALCAGVVTTCVYEFFHCIEHLGYAPKWGWVREMKKTHMAHHFHNETGNFGITNFVCDRLFGTYYLAKDRPRSPTVFNLGYDEDVAKRFPHVARLTPNWPDNAKPIQRRRERAAQSGDIALGAAGPSASPSAS